MNRDVDPALPPQPSPGHRAAVPGRTNRSRHIAHRLRILAARLRATALKLVKLSVEEFVKGFANKTGGITALVLAVVLVAQVLGVDPPQAVRRIFSM